MRISDWSSDVCSSDLLIVLRRGRAELAVNPLKAGAKASRQRKIIGRVDRLFQRVGATRVLRSGGNGDHRQQYAGVRGGDRLQFHGKSLCRSSGKYASA